MADDQSSTAQILLRHYQWNAERLQEEFWTDPARSLQAAGLSPPSSPSTSTASLPPLKSRNPFRQRRREAFECPICCNDYPPDEFESATFSLGCGHRFCRDCWQHYLSVKIKEEGESGRVQCMEKDCNRVVREEAVDELVDGAVATRSVDMNPCYVHN